MLEEVLVCMTCGRPVDGRVYCSDECESQDISSPSLSAVSSAAPSPYLPPSMRGSNLADIPALVPSVLGHSQKGHRARHSVSSSSNSSVGWSALSEDEDDFSGSRVGVAGEAPEFLGSASSVRSSSSAAYLLKPPSALSYARRPSATNHSSTIPLLHRRTSSSTSSLLATSVNSARSHFADYSAEDDMSDAPSASVASSVSSIRSRKNTMRPTSFIETRQETNTVSIKRKRDRTSLPAYFSLLQVSPSSPPSSTSGRSPRSLASLQTLTNISRSLQSSPTTPRIAHPVISLTTATAHSSITSATNMESTPRGRVRRRDPDGRSASNRRSSERSPPRHLTNVHRQYREHSPSFVHHRHDHDAQVRARLNSVEKVADWVASSPVVGRPPTSRRNSSPPPKPKYEQMMRESGMEFGLVGQLYSSSLQHAVVDDDYDVRGPVERRGRRRAHEFDSAPIGVQGPGYGNGRSGLRAREDQIVERPRGRPGLPIR
ncbi:hypothetical protein K474DRAFT_1710650 [Panus rudis PR-1116 ss-1]|nr:hypothetical protein K474DRAFT_1710650 [Panus rudis PR-1116 ss-1]